jgi:hypothetical protein
MLCNLMYPHVTKDIWKCFVLARLVSEGPPRVAPVLVSQKLPGIAQQLAGSTFSYITISVYVHVAGGGVLTGSCGPICCRLPKTTLM